MTLFLGWTSHFLRVLLGLKCPESLKVSLSHQPHVGQWCCFVFFLLSLVSIVCCSLGWFYEGPVRIGTGFECCRDVCLFLFFPFVFEGTFPSLWLRDLNTPFAFQCVKGVKESVLVSVCGFLVYLSVECPIHLGPSFGLQTQKEV